MIYYEHYGSETVAENVKRTYYDAPEVMERFAVTCSFVPEMTRELLDVGCGPGVFLDILRRDRSIVGMGLDAVQVKVDYAREVLGLEAVCSGADELPFANNSFDTVTTLEVLEHLPWGVYENALCEIQRVARRWIVVTVPYCEERALMRCPYCGAWFNPSYHLRSFDEEKLRGLFPEFTLVTLQRHSELQLYPHIVQRIWRWIRPLPFAGNAVCPACGYRRLGARKEQQKKSASRRFLAWRRSWRWWLGVWEAA